jgi:hypothetical protein
VGLHLLGLRPTIWCACETCCRRQCNPHRSEEKCVCDFEKGIGLYPYREPSPDTSYSLIGRNQERAQTLSKPFQYPVKNIN